jgi:4-amino-4-deoxy-L-arabinose transferase-like glycosyltransferase
VRRRLLLLDTLVALLLMAYVLAGVALVPFHGDESIHIHTSGDFDTAFRDGHPSALITEAPYSYDGDPYLRLLNGSVNRHLIGLARQIAGLSQQPLPPRPGWFWALDYEGNVKAGCLPSDELLRAARWPSALLLAASVPLLLALGLVVGGRRVGYPAALVYALNPVVLLNGRRAMQEGSLLGFGLLVVLVAALIARRRQAGRPVRWLWLALVAAGALALASKHSALPFVAGALAWIFLAGLLHHGRRGLLALAAGLLGCAAGMLCGFIALSPALWKDPPARLHDLFVARSQLVEIQLRLQPGGPATLAQRAEGLLLQPFATPPQYFELPAWAGYAPIARQVEQYEASFLGGYATGRGFLGALLTLAMLGGAVLLCVPRWRPALDRASLAGLAAWTALTCLTLLASPLSWQRYTLALLPEAALLAGIGAAAVLRAIRPRASSS